MALNFSSKKSTFVGKTAKYKKKINLSDIKLSFLEYWAPIRNHPLFYLVKDKLINLTFTGLVISLILYSFNITNPIRKGIGLAITLNLLQYYIKWYFKTKEKPWR